MRTSINGRKVRIERDTRNQVKVVCEDSGQEFEPKNVEEKIKLGQALWWESK